MARREEVRLLDWGTLVIDQSHITWNVGCGTPVRFPVYSVLIEHTDGLFMFDSGYDLDLVNAVLPFELPEQTPEQTLPGAARQVRLRAGGRRRDHQLASALRPLRRQPAPDRTRRPTCTARSCARRARPSRSSASATRIAGWDHAGREVLAARGRRRVREGHAPLPHARAHGRALLAAGRAGGQPAAAVHGRRVLHAGGVRGRAAGRVPQQPGRRRALDPPASSGWRKEWDAEIIFTHDMETFRGYALAPEPFTAQEVRA